MYVGSRKLMIKIRSHQENIVLYGIIVIKTSKMTVKKRRGERVPSVTRGGSYYYSVYFHHNKLQVQWLKYYRQYRRLKNEPRYLKKKILIISSWKVGTQIAYTYILL